MMYFLRTGGGLVLVAALLLSTLAPTPAAAQQTRTLTIRDGTIYVDGRQLGPNQVPGDLNLNGMTAQYQFMGIQQPVIELNGRLFAIKNGLKKVSEEEVGGQSTVILQEISARPSAARAEANADADPQRQYLNDVQKANRALYERLLRERTMEQQAQDLARVVRMVDEGDTREAKVDTLRTLLNDIFDLKQENRRREIERLEREIQKLQRSLQKRREMRDRMIDHRLRQLVGTTASQ